MIIFNLHVELTGVVPEMINQSIQADYSLDTNGALTILILL